MKYIGWFSCGVTSSVACKIAIDEGKDVDLWYLETGAEHEDNKRFIKDCGLFCDVEMAGLPIKEIENVREILGYK